LNITGAAFITFKTIAGAIVTGAVIAVCSGADVFGAGHNDAT